MEQCVTGRKEGVGGGKVDGAVDAGRLRLRLRWRFETEITITVKKEPTPPMAILILVVIAPASPQTARQDVNLDTGNEVCTAEAVAWGFPTGLGRRVFVGPSAAAYVAGACDG